MGYYLPETASGQPNLTAKNRVWGFLGESVSVCLETCSPALEPHQENYDVSRKSASGIPLWPSRDPIGELGGYNVYAFVGNDGLGNVDLLGQSVSSTWLTIKAALIKSLVDHGFESLAAFEANSMYWQLIYGGQWDGMVFAPKMMRQWLEGKGDYTMLDEEIKKYIHDENVKVMFFVDITKRVSVGKKFVKLNDINVWPNDKDLYFGMNASFIDFDGCIEWDGGKPKSAKGKFKIRDEYNWNAGDKLSIFGVTIYDDWALLVEKHKGAKSFKIDGEREDEISN